MLERDLHGTQGDPRQRRASGEVQLHAGHRRDPGRVGRVLKAEGETSRVGGGERVVTGGQTVLFELRRLRPTGEVLALPGERVAPAARIAVLHSRDGGKHLTRTHPDDLADAESPVQGEVHVAVVEPGARGLTPHHLGALSHGHLR